MNVDDNLVHPDNNLMTKIDIPKSKSWQMFNEISHRYDLLNHVLSLGIDYYWRKILVSKVNIKSNLAILDVATGTGDLLFSLLKNYKGKIEKAIGCDLSEGMLKKAQEKIGKYKNQIVFQLEDAQALSFSSDSFDAVTITFGIRNVPDFKQGLRELTRVCKPGGQVLVLEFSIPKFLPLKFIYLIYFRYILPIIGAILSGHTKAYKYLNETVETFPQGKSFVTEMEQAGLRRVSQYPLTFGIATLYIGTK